MRALWPLTLDGPNRQHRIRQVGAWDVQDDPGPLRGLCAGAAGTPCPSGVSKALAEQGSTCAGPSPPFPECLGARRATDFSDGWVIERSWGGQGLRCIPVLQTLLGTWSADKSSGGFQCTCALTATHSLRLGVGVTAWHAGSQNFRMNPGFPGFKFMDKSSVYTKSNSTNEHLETVSNPNAILRLWCSRSFLERGWP